MRIVSEAVVSHNRHGNRAVRPYQAGHGRAALRWMLLTCLYLSCHFLRAMYLRDPLKGVVATVVFEIAHF